MKPSDRTLALNAAWAALWWLVDPEHNRWAKTLEVLNDPASRVTIERGSGDDTGRRSVGGHSDPTGDAAGAVLEAGLDGRKQARDLRRSVATVAESARFLVATMTEQPYDNPDTIEHAISDIVWLVTVPHTAEAWRTDDDELRHEFDHAIEHLHAEAKLLANRCRSVLAEAVREKPKVEQPKRTECRTHAAWRQERKRLNPDAYVEEVPATKHGLCDRCRKFKENHKVPPTPAIIDRWERHGNETTPPALIMEAKAAAKTKRKKAG